VIADDATLLGGGMSFPPRIGPDGRLAVSSGAANVRESIRIILATDRRERLTLPQFGGDLHRLLFEPNTSATRRRIKERITQALGRWERRVRVESVRVTADPRDPRSAVATIRYRLVATGAGDRLDLNLRLGS
jgi:phage baseplate assembly protein W